MTPLFHGLRFSQKKLATERAAAGYVDAAALASDLDGVSAYVAGSWEDGRSKPDIDQFLQIVRKLRVSPDDLLAKTAKAVPSTS